MIIQLLFSMVYIGECVVYSTQSSLLAVLKTCLSAVQTVKSIVSDYQFLYMKYALLGRNFKNAMQCHTIVHTTCWCLEVYGDIYIPVDMLSLGRAVPPA